MQRKIQRAETMLDAHEKRRSKEKEDLQNTQTCIKRGYQNKDWKISIWFYLTKVICTQDKTKGIPSCLEIKKSMINRKRVTLIIGGVRYFPVFLSGIVSYNSGMKLCGEFSWGCGFLVYLNCKWLNSLGAKYKTR